MASYRPKWYNLSKYSVYASYFREYLAYKDYKSLKASLKYLFSHRLPSEEYTASSRMGKFLVRKGTTDFQYINYAYEREIKKYIEQHLNDFDVFIDIGACIGEYSIWLAGQGKKCIAFEPVNFKAVYKNIELSKQNGKIKVFTCGLGSRKERVFFQVLAENTGASYRDPDAKEEPNVQIETFDSLIDQFDIKDSDRVLIKLDAEGMEPEVIAGAKEFIRRQKQLTFIYEQFQGDNKTDEALQAVTAFEIKDIDEANKIAVKK